MTKPYRVAVVLGTRPEAIKLAPVIRELERRPATFSPVVIATSQHREMLVQACEAFGIVPDLDLGLTHANRTLAQFTAQALLALTDAFRRLLPDMLLVQGDTSTVVAAALAAFYSGIPIGHIEAGLRSGDLRRPFPEEANRRMATAVTDIHFAPTEGARHNLTSERIPALAAIEPVLHGVFEEFAAGLHYCQGEFTDPTLRTLPWSERRTVLVTAHRRETLGDRLHGVCQALKELVRRHPTLQLVFPVHLNPKVREVVVPELGRTDRVILLDPLGYRDVIEVMRRSDLVLTDSGGLQEEAPSLRKPVVILRDVTERPEVVASGFGVLVGTEPAQIIATVDRLLADPLARARMTQGENPFGDGRASERICDAIERYFQNQHRSATAPVAMAG